MKVVCNDVLCQLEIKGSVIKCVPVDDTENATEMFACSEIRQLLRSRHNLSLAKLILGTKTIMMRFLDSREREIFVDLVQNMDKGSGDNEDWVTSSICHAAVDLEIIDEATLDSLVKEECQRGVVVAFDAIGSLVDPETFKLRPITEQMANDVLRQVPVLAKIFEGYVKNEETRQRFWEAVVRKYFCFSRTFLEEEMRELEPEASGPHDPPSPPDALSGINAASSRALPKGQGAAARFPPAPGAAPAAEQRPLDALFRGRPSARLWTREVGAVSPPAPHATVHRPPVVSRTRPREGASRETLELLKRFWSSDVSKRGTMREKLQSAKNASGGGVQRLCLDQARRFLEQLNVENS